MKQKVTTEFEREKVIGAIRRLDLSKAYTVTIRQRQKRRSLDQNALWWLWLTCIESETGNDRNDLHGHFKKRWVKPETVAVFGNTYMKYSTRGLNTGQFKELLDKLQVFASSELSIALPDPDDKHWDEFYEHYRDKL